VNDLELKKKEWNNDSEVQRAVDRLREEWSQLHRAVTDRRARWRRCNDVWTSLHADMEVMREWLNHAQSIVKTCPGRNIELEKQATLKHRTMQAIVTRGEEIGQAVEPQTDQLAYQWKTLLAILQSARLR